MTIPDQLFYACIGPAAGAVVWWARQFVISSISRWRQEGSGPADISPARGAASSAGMTVRDYQQIRELMVKELNGRYMLAKEARERFDALAEKIEDVRRLLEERLTKERERENVCDH